MLDATAFDCTTEMEALQEDGELEAFRFDSLKQEHYLNMEGDGERTYVRDIDMLLWSCLLRAPGFPFWTNMNDYSAMHGCVSPTSRKLWISGLIRVRC